MVTTISLRNANIFDAPDIFHWRNDKLTIQMSKNSHSVDMDEHMAWLTQSLADANRFLIICENLQRDKLGIVWFQLEGFGASVSINLSPKFRGWGLSKKCLEQSINYLAERKLDIRYIKSIVKVSNSASKSLFSAAGFTELENDGQFITFSKSN